MRNFRTLVLTLVLGLAMAAPLNAALQVTVRAGDSLAAIGERHGVSAQAIASANGIRNPAMISIGTTLSIPSGGSSSSTSTSSASSTSSSGSHTVAPGENLGAIAARYGTTTAALVEANNIADPAMIVAGTRLRISGTGSSTGSSSASSTTVAASSSSGSHTVAPGENLGAIAARYGTSAQALASANGIANPNMVVAGTRLRIVSGGSSTPASSNASSASASGGTVHTVAPGENLGAIAVRYGTTVESLTRMNGLRDPNTIGAGTTLRIVAGGGTPSTVSTISSSSSGGVHTVAPGENLGAIAARYGTSAQALASANGIANPNMIVAGTRLQITGGGTTTPAPGPSVPVTAATSGWGGQPGSTEVRSLLDQASARHGVDPALARAIAWQESGYWQGARSSVGAIGVMQLMPATAAWAGPALLGRDIDPTNVRDNVDAGTAYIAYLQRNTSSRDQAVASYYQGLGSVTSRGYYDDTK